VEGEGKVRWSGQCCHLYILDSLPYPLLPDRDGEEVRHMVEEGTEINQPRLGKEQGKISYLRIESSIDGSWHPPSGIDLGFSGSTPRLTRSGCELGHTTSS
jgi:hypothetical protein